MNRVVRPSRRTNHEAEGEQPFENSNDQSNIANQMNAWQQMQMGNMERLDDIEHDQSENSQINGSALGSQYLDGARSSMDLQSDGIRVSQSQANFGGLRQSEDATLRSSNLSLGDQAATRIKKVPGRKPSVNFEESDSQSQLSDAYARRMDKIVSNIIPPNEHMHYVNDRKNTIEKRMNLPERSQEQLREEERKANKNLYDYKNDRYN